MDNHKVGRFFETQCLYLDRITIVPWHHPWRHLVNDTDLCRTPKSPKISIKPRFGVQGHSKSLNLAPIKSQCTTSY